MPKKVFISYKKEPMSKLESQRLFNQLKRDGFDVFRDEDETGAGVNWQQTIYENVRTSDVLIVLLEPETAKSEWVQREVDVARGAGVSILPLRIAHTTFTEADIRAVQEKLVITSTHYAIFTSEEYAKGNFSQTEIEEAQQRYLRLLNDIRKQADETRVRQRQWAQDILIRHTQYPADTNPDYYRFVVKNKRGDDVTIYLATGDITRFTNINVIVNSENDYMQMARFFESHTMSSTIRRAGAHNRNWKFIGDRIQQELDEQVQKVYGSVPVPLGQVLVTSAGHPDSILVSQKVRYIFHASTNQVIGDKHLFKLKPFEKDAITKCVRNCLEKVMEVDHQIDSIAFPIFGTGHNGLNISEVVPYIVRGMLQFIKSDDVTNIKHIFLGVYSNNDIEDVKRMMQKEIN